MTEQVYSPSDFVGVFNQTIEYAYPNVVVEGELANFKVSRGQWVYFDLKDDYASVRYFGSVYKLPGPIEDGMMIRVVGQPRLHPQYGFSVSFSAITPVGEGSISKAAKLLEVKLNKEGLFDPARKRKLPYPPKHIGLVTATGSAAYADFIKVLGARWGGMTISHIDAKVQGDEAVTSIVEAINQLNQLGDAPDVIVLTRGGGSADDLAAFSSEQVTRAVAGSRIPMLVAIGHEIDLSLAEMTADAHASTPSNAAELLVPDKLVTRQNLDQSRREIAGLLRSQLENSHNELSTKYIEMGNYLTVALMSANEKLNRQNELLNVLNPKSILKRGYALVEYEGKVVSSIGDLLPGQRVVIGLQDGEATATIDEVKGSRND